MAFDADCEVIWIKMHFHQQQVLVGFFYRPPSSGIADFKALDQSILKIIESRRSIPHVIMAGDFNQPDRLVGKHCTRKQYIKEINFKLLDIINKTSFNQIADEPTRGSNILDLIFLTYSAQLEETHTTPGMSDHLAVSTNLNIKINRTKKHHVKFTISKRLTASKLKLLYPLSMKNSANCQKYP